jgi:hypothetical protein
VHPGSFSLPLSQEFSESVVSIDIAEGQDDFDHCLSQNLAAEENCLGISPPVLSHFAALLKCNNVPYRLRKTLTQKYAFKTHTYYQMPKKNI